MLQLPQAKCWSEKPTAKLKIPTNTNIQAAAWLCVCVSVCVWRRRYANSCRMLVGYWKRFTCQPTCTLDSRQPTADNQQSAVKTWPCGSFNTLYLQDCLLLFLFGSYWRTLANFPVNNGRECLMEFCNYSGEKHTKCFIETLQRDRACVEILFNNGKIKLYYYKYIWCVFSLASWIIWIKFVFVTVPQDIYIFFFTASLGMPKMITITKHDGGRY